MTDQIQEHVNQLSQIRDRIEELWFSTEPIPGIHLDGNHEEYEKLTKAEKKLEAVISALKEENFL